MKLPALAPALSDRKPGQIERHVVDQLRARSPNSSALGIGLIGSFSFSAHQYHLFALGEINEHWPQGNGSIAG